MLKPPSNSAVETLATIPGRLAHESVRMWRGLDMSTPLSASMALSAGPRLAPVEASRERKGATANAYRLTSLRIPSTEGAIRSTMTSTPSAVGCMPSVWLSFGSPATPSRKNG